MGDRARVVTLLVSSLLLSARADAYWYRWRVVRADVAPLHHGQPWDNPPANPKDPPKACCLRGEHRDGAAPDVEVTAHLGSNQLATRMRQDEFHPQFRDFGFIEGSAGEPLVVEVWDRDGDGRELIGRTTLRPDKRGVFANAPLKFDEVERLELEMEKVDAPVETITVTPPDGELDTHLFLAAHQRARLTASGRMCWGKVCGTPDEARSDVNRPGHLLAFDGADDAEKVHDYQPLLELAPETSGFLKLYVKPADGRPSGSYSVVVTIIK
jgi:hypothetical protein